MENFEKNSVSNQSELDEFIAENQAENERLLADEAWLEEQGKAGLPKKNESTANFPIYIKKPSHSAYDPVLKNGREALDNNNLGRFLR